MVNAEDFGKLRAKGILFGDDNWGTVLDEQPPYKNSKGVEVKRYLIVPSPHLVKQYPILQKPGALTYKGYALWVEYPLYWISDNNPSRTNAIARIDCGFDGRETTQTKRVEKLSSEIKMLQMEKENLEISNINLLEQNNILLGDITKLASKLKDFQEVLGGEKKKSQLEEFDDE